MDHQDCIEALHDHHFGELDREADERVRTHLAECGDCALEYCRLRADLERLGALHARPGPSVKTALRAKVAAEFVPSPWSRVASFFTLQIPIYQPALVLALVVAVVALAWPNRAPSNPNTDHPTVVDQFDGADLRIVDHRVL